MKRRIGFIVEAVIDCIAIPLYFIKFFCDVAVLPSANENGEYAGTNRFYHYYSIYDRIGYINMQYLVWVAIAVAAISIVLSVLSIIFKRKSLHVASHAIFGVALVLFIGLCFTARMIWLCY